jgi:hypothetical protein
MAQKWRFFTSGAYIRRAVRDHGELRGPTTDAQLDRRQRRREDPLPCDTRNERHFPQSIVSSDCPEPVLANDGLSCKKNGTRKGVSAPGLGAGTDRLWKVKLVLLLILRGGRGPVVLSVMSQVKEGEASDSGKRPLALHSVPRDALQGAA